MRRYFLMTLISLLALQGTTYAQSAEDKLAGFLRILDKYYIDEVDEDSLAEEAIKAVLKDMDPHSNYLDKKALQKSNEELGGNFEGVGIQFNILKDTIYVVQTISGGPSEKVGIMAGDKIVEVDEENVAGIGIDNAGVIKRLRGEKGTKVEVKIKRGGVSELLDFLITRDKIPLFAMNASYMIDETTGYVKLSRFSAMELLNAAGIRKVSSEELKDGDFDEAVYAQLDCDKLYARNADDGFDFQEFFKHPELYHSVFEPYQKGIDLFINAIYWDPKAPAYFSKEQMADENFRIKVIADITCDIAPEASIPSTLRSSTISDPVYGYDPVKEEETAAYSADVIDVMAVDNLPNELSRDASESFGDQFMEFVMAELLKESSEFLDRATIAKDGDLCPPYEYLRSYVEGK